MPTAGYREPDEPRGSRPVLRERGGETPPRHSPAARASLLDLVAETWGEAGGGMPQLCAAGLEAGGGAI